MIELVFASNNIHKIEEIKNLLPSFLNLKSLNELNFNGDIEENAQTIEGNALLKAKFIAENYNCNCFSDDSGLEVEALNGAPGVHSARYAGLPKNDANNRKKLLKELQFSNNKNAQFKTVICLILNNNIYYFTGIIKGKIINDEKGNNGFGYDAIFIPNGYDKTFAEMSFSEKTKISHRAIALNKMIDFLENHQK